MYTLTPRRLALLSTINWCEGLPGYNQAFNYIEFNNYGPHPNLKTPFGNTYSTAAGAYQFLYSTWQSAISHLGLPDYMSPENQDQAALYLVEYRKALALIDAGDLPGALQKLSWEWASIPVVYTETIKGKTYQAGSGRYGQGTKTLPAITEYYNNSLAFYSGGPVTITPVAYNEAVKKKSLLKRAPISRSFAFSWPGLFTSSMTKKNTK